MKFEEAILKAQKMCKSGRYVCIERVSNKARVIYYSDTKRIRSPIEEGIDVLDLIADDWRIKLN